MSVMLDDETLQMYVEEAREHLEDIEGSLLEIEQAGDDVDEDLVNNVFRAAHSIKGGAGFLGLNNIKELAHKIENVLDMVRNREMTPTSEVVNVILQAFDRLQELLGSVAESNEMDISDHIVALQGLTSVNLPGDKKETLENQVTITSPDGRSEFTISEFDLSQAKKGGKFLYIAEYDLIHDVHRKDKTPLEVIKNLNDSGVIVDLKVDLASVGSLEDEQITPKLPMFVLFASIIEPDLVGKLLDLDDQAVQLIPEEEEEEKEKDKEQEPAAAEEQEEESKEVQETEVQETEAEEQKPEAKSEAQAAEEEKAESESPQKQQETSRQQKDKRPQAEKKEPEKKDKEPAKSSKSKSATQQETTLRVHVSVLDQLMNLAGELVLSRNQLMQSISTDEKQSMENAAQRIDLVTSELQEAIMLTRMQPVGNIFNKFPRVVRDLSRELGKEIELELQGKDVELDKTIIEGLGDPLTHLVRNSADHGVETPEERTAKGKAAQGNILLKAYHESGQVNIEIKDDGKGMDPDKIADKAVQKGLIDSETVSSMSEKEKVNLIMLPGLSTADQVSDVSGRGVGMDVVKSNLDKLGGQVEMDSKPDQGTTIRIKLPLTLAIIPSLLVSAEGERFAISQVNVSELLRIPASKIRERIEKVGDAEVLILRGELIPLLYLTNVLGLPRTFIDPETGKRKIDRREGLSDIRLTERVQTAEEIEEQNAKAQNEQENLPSERRHLHSSDVNIVVVNAGTVKYGLVVDELHDSVEIVVKPLGRHLKMIPAYAGATIMGDGHVALILDVPGLARIAELSSMAGSERASEIAAEESAKKEGVARQSLLFFRNAPDENCAILLDLVARVEQIKASQIEIVGGKKVIQYRGGNLPVFALEEVANVGMLEDNEELIVLVFNVQGREVGLLASPPVDAKEVDLAVDEKTLRQTGISGSAIIDGSTTLLVDIYELVKTLNPSWFSEDSYANTEPRKRNVKNGQGEKKILLVEDSDFFRAQVKKYLQDEGYNVVEAEDGQVAWEYLNQNAEEIALVVTDLEMPNMDGFELSKHIRADDRFQNNPVIALTSLADKEDMQKGKEVGIDDYQIKLDKEKLLHSVDHYFQEFQALA